MCSTEYIYFLAHARTGDNCYLNYFSNAVSEYLLTYTYLDIDLSLTRWGADAVVVGIELWRCGTFRNF